MKNMQRYGVGDEVAIKIGKGASLSCKPHCFLMHRIAGIEKSFNFAPGEMAERSIAAVLKTVDPQGSGGSNPSLSAQMAKCKVQSLFRCTLHFSI